MTNPQRVDVESASEIADKLRYIANNRGLIQPGSLHTAADTIAALLQQLAERDALIELLRNIAERERLHMQTKLRAAERARDEAHGLLRDVIAWRRTVPIDETPNRKDGGIFGRIAAFLAANGTAMVPTHSAGGE